MKNTAFLLLTLVLISCGSEKSENKASDKTDSTSEVVKETKAESKYLLAYILTDITAIEQLDAANPIEQFQELAKKDAKNIVTLSKDNIAEVLELAKEYKYLVITTGTHTIVKVTDLNNCTQSGSWGACMPIAKGYIKKGNLILKEGYMNNIIGTPDSQVRTAYFFN